MPTVSIIISTFNRSNLLRRAIESVCSQTFEDWELIIIDNGSNDDTAKVIGEYVQKDARISSVYQKRIKLSRVRTLGSRMVKGQYVTFLDDDDYYFPNKLDVQVEFLEQHKDIALVYSYLEMVDENQKVFCVLPEKPATNYLELIHGNSIQLNSSLFRRKCFNQIGSFNTSLDSCDDYEFCLRLAKEFQIAFLPVKVGVYSWHQQNMSHNKFLRIKNEMNIYKKIWTESLIQEERTVILRRVLELTYWKASDAFASRNYSDACLYFFMAIYFDPFIGLSVPWGRFSNSIFRFFRPYGAVIYSAFKLILTRRSNA